MMKLARAVQVGTAVLALAAPAWPWQDAPAPAGQEAADEKDDEAEEDFKEEEPTGSAKVREDEIKAKACPAVDVKFSADTDKKTHPTPEPPEGKAVVYVLRASRGAGKIQTKLGMNGKWVGVNRARNYFVLTVDPGEHYFCSKAENTSVLALKAEAGGTYYVEQKIKMGFMKARNKLAVLPEAEGKAKLAKSHPSTWQEKK